MPTMGNGVLTGGGGFAFAPVLASFFERRIGDAVFFMSVVHVACGSRVMAARAEGGEVYKPGGSCSTCLVVLVEAKAEGFLPFTFVIPAWLAGQSAGLAHLRQAGGFLVL